MLRREGMVVISLPHSRGGVRPSILFATRRKEVSSKRPSKHAKAFAALQTATGQGQAEISPIRGGSSNDCAPATQWAVP